MRSSCDSRPLTLSCVGTEQCADGQRPFPAVPAAVTDANNILVRRATSVSGAKAAARMMDRYKSDRWRKDAASTVVATFLGGNLAHPGAR